MTQKNCQSKHGDKHAPNLFTQTWHYNSVAKDYKPQWILATVPFHQLPAPKRNIYHISKWANKMKVNIQWDYSQAKYPKVQCGHNFGTKHSITFQKLSKTFARPIPVMFYHMTSNSKYCLWHHIKAINKIFKKLVHINCSYKAGDGLVLYTVPHHGQPPCCGGGALQQWPERFLKSGGEELTKSWPSPWEQIATHYQCFCAGFGFTADYGFIATTCDLVVTFGGRALGRADTLSAGQV